MNRSAALADPQVRAALRHSTGRCLAWTEQQLPEGSAPGTARIGVELRDGAPARLLVDRGVSYLGPHDELRGWFADGVLEFDTLDELLAWVDHWLVRNVQTVGTGAGLGSRGSRASRLTDLSAVDVPPTRQGDSVLLDPADLGDLLSEEVVGQKRAISTLSRRVCEHVAQCEPRRPLSLFAVGPSGVGKTAAVERLATALGSLSGADWGYLRLDMNEYRERHRISQLLGAPAGYLGHHETPPIIDLLEQHPHAVILFDEIDKAHRDVMITLMAALDAGRLTAGDGRTVDLRHTIVIFTSNRHADALGKAITRDSTEAEVDAACRTQLLDAGTWPELVGRVRSHILFEPLAATALAEVAVLSIERAAVAYGLRVNSVEARAVTELLGHSADLGLGVRRLEHDATALFGEAFMTFLSSGSTLRDVDISWHEGAPVLRATGEKSGGSR